MFSSSPRNDEEEDRTEKVEKGTKVKRKLSSLRNRMTGSFNKDKVKPYHRPFWVHAVMYCSTVSHRKAVSVTALFSAFLALQKQTINTHSTLIYLCKPYYISGLWHSFVMSHTSMQYVCHTHVFAFLPSLQGKNREKEQQKEKMKEKGKEAREKVCSSINGHLLEPGSFSSCTTCSLCSKTLQKKHGLQCMSE